MKKRFIVLIAMLLFASLVFAQTLTSAKAAEMLAKSKAVDTSNLKTTDNQPLIEWEPLRVAPKRPANPSALSEFDALHWFDTEYAGYNVSKMAMPARPSGGAIGKYVVLLQAGHHPYWTGYINGFKKVAEAYGMKYKIYNGNWTLDLQAQQAEQAINDRPDIIVFAPSDQSGALPILRKLWQAKIPVITSNTIPSDEAMKYTLSWVGPDDWGQFRKLARSMADKLGKKGGYAIVQGVPGTSCFNGRTWSVVTELATYAPAMKLLDKDVSNYKSEPTFQMVSTWLSKYGNNLNAIVLPDDGETMAACLQAVKNAGRKDIVIVAAGHSKTGLDAVKSGDAYALTYQSAESDGAMGLQMAADWLNGYDLPNVRAIAQRIITKEIVNNYYPTQW